MTNQSGKLRLIRLPYWLGIVADALWAVALFVPEVYGALIGNPDFTPDQQTRLIMALGGIMMTGWTLLLVWAVRDPIKRRGVILLTAFPVVFGLFIVTLLGVLNGDTFMVWILVKVVILFVTMITSFVLSNRIARTTNL